MAIAHPAKSTPWRHVPNALSLARIACAPILVVLAVVDEQPVYTWLLVPALLTDALDGVGMTVMVAGSLHAGFLAVLLPFVMTASFAVVIVVARYRREVSMMPVTKPSIRGMGVSRGGR